ncbi:MAG TPA: histidine kinase [Acidimicrobiales bacterium]|nr:histidine kinase [Acidimicrobiales bacterium]
MSVPEAIIDHAYTCMDGESEAVKAPRLIVVAAVSAIAIAATAGTILLELASDHGGPDPGVQASLHAWLILPYVFCGLFAWYRKPESRFGLLMIAAGFVTLLSSVSAANSNLLFTIGTAFDLVAFAVFMHAFLAFPTGALRSHGERVLVGATYAVASLNVVGLMLSGFDPGNAFSVIEAPELAADLLRLQLVAVSVLFLIGFVVMVTRRGAAGRPLPTPVRVLVSFFSLAFVMGAVLLLSLALEIPLDAFLTIQRTMFVVVGLAPFVFLLAVLDARLARSAVGDLLVELRSEPAPADLREPLSRALRDPTVSLAYWLPQYDTWADQDGRPVSLPRPGDPRSVTVIDSDGGHLAALIHDPSLDEEPQLLQAVGAAAGIALENGRLQVELKAKLQELEGSRARVIEAGQRERKRLERNLHDGAQQRLIALSLELQRYADKLAVDPKAQSQIEAARREIAVSLDELRAVARGLHPAVVTGHGLGVALVSLAAGSSVPAKLNVAIEERLDESIEVAAYYVVSESLANIGKHARATTVTIEVTRECDELVVEVVDDGVGGADSERGTGLRGLADRVEGLGGQLRVWTPSGGGTRVRAQMPCG